MSLGKAFDDIDETDLRQFVDDQVSEQKKNN
jgi:hypothetical protein